MNNLVSVLTSYAFFEFSNVNITNNYCYTAILLEKGTYINSTNFTCINNNAIQYALDNPQDFGSCLDLKNTRNGTIHNMLINSCFSQETTCGLKIYLEIETERNTLYNQVSFIILLIFLLISS